MPRRSGSLSDSHLATDEEMEAVMQQKKSAAARAHLVRLFVQHPNDERWGDMVASMTPQDAKAVFGFRGLDLQHRIYDSEQFLHKMIVHVADEKGVQLQPTPDALVDRIVADLEIQSLACGGAWSVVVDEANRNHFVNAVLKHVVVWLKQEVVAWGHPDDHVDFGCIAQAPVVAVDEDDARSILHGHWVMMVNQTFLLVTVVKDTGMLQGRVAAMFQMHAAYSRNEVKFPVFGCVTTMDDFVFLRYDGDQFVASTPMHVDKGAPERGVFDRAQLVPSLRPIIDMLSKLLQLELGCASPPIKPIIESRRAMAAKREDAEKAAAAAGGANQ